MTELGDRLVADYLAQVQRATADLPPSRRNELVGDLREHIETRRAELPTETEAEVRAILDRLGDPVSIAEEAGAGTGTGTSTIVENDASHGGRHRVLLIGLAAVVLVALCIAGAFFIAGGS